MTRVSIDVSEADALLHGRVRPFPAENVSLWDAAGRILREPVKADAAYPPFDRVCMDGFALRHSSIVEGRTDFAVKGFVPAGGQPIPLNDAAGCLEIMTGAALPSGCDCIVPVEETIREGETVSLKPGISVRPGQHVHPIGRDYLAGDILLEAGVRMLGPQLAVAAAVGCGSLTVSSRPRIHLILTGDELVAVDQKPKDVQIRMTHPFALRGMLQPWADLRFVHVRDRADEIQAAVETGLAESDILLMTGGVSAGRHDLVPETLAALGAKILFHKVKQRPGKPIWVGESKKGKPIFAFPGNPVAATVCARRFLLPWLWRCLEMDEPIPLRLPLTDAMKSHDTLTLFAPMTRRAAPGGGWELHPVPVRGSGDFAGLSGSHGFAEIQAGGQRIQAGEMLPYYDWGFA